MRKLNLVKVRPLIQMAVEEDLGAGDITSRLLFTDGVTARANIVSREEIIVCGMTVAAEILRFYDERLTVRTFIPDGKVAHVGARLGVIEGPYVPMLSAERVVLNFLQRLSGIATTTGKYVRAVKGTRARIYDTRKTLPGWRTLEKYAVRCGGGYNHRMGLYDAVLIKDNHLADIGRNFDRDFEKRLTDIVQKAHATRGIKFVAVEVDHVDDQLDHVLRVPGVDIVLLDNMGQWQLKHAVQMRDAMCAKSGRPLLEASGNVTLHNVSAIAQSGVDRIAIGALTHSATAVDIGLDR